jgi:hypothetical protein
VTKNTTPIARENATYVHGLRLPTSKNLRARRRCDGDEGWVMQRNRRQEFRPSPAAHPQPVLRQMPRC